MTRNVRITVAQKAVTRTGYITIPFINGTWSVESVNLGGGDGSVIRHVLSIAV